MLLLYWRVVQFLNLLKIYINLNDLDSLNLRVYILTVIRRLIKVLSCLCHFDGNIISNEFQPFCSTCYHPKFVKYNYFFH